MAAIGTSISRLKSRRMSAARDLPKASICACCTLKITASAIEQQNEIASEPRTVRTRISIGAARGHSSAGASVAEWLVSRESEPFSAMKPANCVKSAARRAGHQLLLLLLQELGNRA